MAKQNWKPGNMLYPLPAVMVSCQSSTAHDPLCERPELDGKPNIITVAWAGTVCTNPPMVSISVRPERYSYHLIEESGEFVINLITEKLVKATDYCGVRSGRDVDKFKEMHLTPLASKHIHAPGIAESPVNIECKVREIKPLGSHSMILADVVGVTIDDKRRSTALPAHVSVAPQSPESHGKDRFPSPSSSVTPSFCTRSRSRVRRRQGCTAAQNLSHRLLRSWCSPDGTGQGSDRTDPVPSSAHRCRTW